MIHYSVIPKPLPLLVHHQHQQAPGFWPVFNRGWSGIYFECVEQREGKQNQSCRNFGNRSQNTPGKNQESKHRHLNRVISPRWGIPPRHFILNHFFASQIHRANLLINYNFIYLKLNQFLRYFISLQVHYLGKYYFGMWIALYPCKQPLLLSGIKTQTKDGGITCIYKPRARISVKPVYMYLTVHITNIAKTKEGRFFTVKILTTSPYCTWLKTKFSMRRNTVPNHPKPVLPMFRGEWEVCVWIVKNEFRANIQFVMEGSGTAKNTVRNEISGIERRWWPCTTQH